LGIKILDIGNIEPDSTRSFRFVFNPPEGYKVSDYTIDVGEIIEES
jgi:hypothetical protein